MEFIEILALGLDAVSTTVTLSDAISKLDPHRKCGVQITNSSKCYVLQNPEMYVCKGTCVDPLPPTILPSSSGSAVFAKTRFTGQGFSGICTYDLLDKSTQKAAERLAVFFKVPYNLNLKPNQLTVGVFDIKESEKSLFDEMSKKAGPGFTKSKAGGSFLTHTGQNVTIKATMSNIYQAVVKVHFSDKETLMFSTL